MVMAYVLAWLIVPRIWVFVREKKEELSACVYVATSQLKITNSYGGTKPTALWGFRV